MEEDLEFLSYVKEILESDEFQKRKQYHHHHNLSVYDHSLDVSYKAYNIAKKRKLDTKSTAIGALLHDFYYEDWQLSKTKKPFFKKHGFVHAKEACENAKKTFPNLINKKIENIILRHMFPLNIHPPKYKEAWIVTYVDKISSLNVLKHPSDYLMYIGIRKRR